MTKTILFVDEEKFVHKALKRSFRNMRQEWDMQFAASPSEALEILNEDNAKTVLETLSEKVHKLDKLDSQAFQPLMKEIQKEKGIKGPFLWKPVRVAITGTVSGPDLPLVIDVFGKEKVLDFLKQALNKYVKKAMNMKK